MAQILGVAAGVFASATANGAAYGLLLYGWYGLSSALAYGIPKGWIAWCEIVSESVVKSPDSARDLDTSPVVFVQFRQA